MAVKFEDIPSPEDKIKQLQKNIVTDNVEQLKQSFNDTAQQCESKPAAVEYLCPAYAEVKQRKILPKPIVRQFIEYELVNSSYEQLPTLSVRDAKVERIQQNAQRLLASRVDDLVKDIDLIIQHHNSGLYDDIDDIFIERLHHVHSHLFFLEKQHRKMFLVQLQFCIQVFLRLKTMPHIRHIGSFVMDKVRLIRFLQLVRDEITRPPKPAISFEKYFQYVEYVLQTFRKRVYSVKPSYALNSPNRKTIRMYSFAVFFPKRFRRWIRNTWCRLSFHYVKRTSSPGYRSPAEYFQYVKYYNHSSSQSQTFRIPGRIRTMIVLDLKESKKLLDSWNAVVCFEDHPPQYQSWLRSHYEKTIKWNDQRRKRKQFKELHDTYYIIKQYYSIEKILNTLEFIPEITADSPPPPSTIIAIKRTLQVIGETIKSTRNTPNITKKLDGMLKRLISPTLTERMKDLRQFFSHGYSLEKLEMEKETELLNNASLFQVIAEDLRELRRWFQYMHTLHRLNIFRRFFGHLYNFKSMEVLQDYMRFLGREADFSFETTKYEPKHLTEARDFLQTILENPSSSITNSSLTESARDDLKCLLEKILDLTNAISEDERSITETMNSYATLLKYICLPSGVQFWSVNVHKIARQFLSRTKRNTLFEKTDFENHYTLLTRLKNTETNDDRRDRWGSICQRLVGDNYEGINTLLRRTEQRPDAALDATIETMRQLGLPLDDEDYLQFVNRRLSKSYYPNVFVLDNKYRVLKEVVKDRRSQVAPREALAPMKELRRADESLLQQQYDRLLGRMEEILGHACFDTTRADQIALEYCLLEVAEILCSLGLFRGNVNELRSLVPVVTGRNLRNYLAHDGLAYDTLTGMSEITFTNAKWLINNRIKLYQRVTNQPKTAASLAYKPEPVELNLINEKRMGWTEQLTSFFEIVKQLDISKLEQQMIDHGQSGTDLLLLQKNFRGDTVLKIAENGHPSRFIAQLLNYRPSNDNFFYLLLTNTQSGCLKNRVNNLIASPFEHCFGIALRSGLWEEIENIWPQRDNDIAEAVLSSELPNVLNLSPIVFIKKLLKLVPTSWILEMKDEFSNTIVHWAVLRGDQELLRLVLHEYGSLIKVPNQFGDIPLWLATRYHGQPIDTLLLNFSFNPIESKCEDLEKLKTKACSMTDRIRQSLLSVNCYLHQRSSL